MKKVIRQHQWSEQELVGRGFNYFPRKKQLVMARELPASEAPKTIVTAWDTLVAQAGYVICYEPGDMVWPNLDDYFQWPVEPEIFGKTYAAWDEPGWKPTPAEARLMQLGCKPFYKQAGVWAKKLNEDTMIQSLESPEPVNVPPGAWVSIGVEGEPYAMSERSFSSRYEADIEKSPTVIQRMINFLRRGKK